MLEMTVASLYVLSTCNVSAVEWHALKSMAHRLLYFYLIIILITYGQVWHATLVHGTQ